MHATIHPINFMNTYTVFQWLNFLKSQEMFWPILHKAIIFFWNAMFNTHKKYILPGSF